MGRLNDLEAAVHVVPKTFRDIKLPLLLGTLKRTKAQAEGAHISKITQYALIPVVDSYHLQVELLDTILVKNITRNRRV